MKLLPTILLSLLAASANAQCYTDPRTGQQICPQQGGDYRIGEAPQGQQRQSQRMTPDGRFSVAPVEPQQPWKDSRVVKIRNSEGNGFGWGSGAVVKVSDDPRYVLTAAHVTGGQNDWVLVIFNDGRDNDVAQVIGIDRQADCALLKLAGNARADAFAIAANEPTSADMIYAAGFPDAKGVRIRTTVGGPINPNTIELDGGSIQGESGGPICNEKQEVVGVIHSTDGRATYCARLCSVHAMLTRCCPPPPGYYAQPPGYRPPTQQPQPTRPPLPATQPQTPIAGQPGRPGEKGEKGDKGDKGDPGAPGAPGKCDQEQMQVVINAAVLAAFQKYEEEHPPVKVPTIDEITADVIKKLPPLHIRVADQRGPGYSTEFQEAKLGQYITLPFGPNTTAQ